jgi:hypothetical protein
LPAYPGPYTPSLPPCVHAVGLTTTNSHTSLPRLTLSSRHIRAPSQPLCAKLSRPCQRGRTTSNRTRLSRRASTPSLAQLDSTPGPVGVCDFLSKSLMMLSVQFIPAIFFPTKFSDDRFFDALTARTCHGHPLPCNSATNNTCVSEDDAASVFAIGDFEYKLRVLPSGRSWILDLLKQVIFLCSYIWNAAQNASTYNSLTFGNRAPTHTPHSTVQPDCPYPR